MGLMGLLCLKMLRVDYLLRNVSTVLLTNLMTSPYKLWIRIEEIGTLGLGTIQSGIRAYKSLH
jgi:hypothetical protein